MNISQIFLLFFVLLLPQLNLAQGIPVILNYSLSEQGHSCEPEKAVANYPVSIEFGDSIKYLLYTDANGQIYDTIITPRNPQSGFSLPYPFIIRSLDSSNAGMDRWTSLHNHRGSPYQPYTTLNIADFNLSPYRKLSNCNDFRIYSEVFVQSPLKVKFHHTYAQIDHQLSWDFGDGNTSDEMFPEHSYASPGTYIYSLSIGNCQLQTDTITVSAQNPPLCAGAISYDWLAGNERFILHSDLHAVDQTAQWTVEGINYGSRPVIPYSGKLIPYSYSQNGCPVLWDTIYPPANCNAAFLIDKSQGKIFVEIQNYQASHSYTWSFTDKQGNVHSRQINHAAIVNGKFEINFPAIETYFCQLKVEDSVSNCADTRCSTVHSAIGPCQAYFYVDSAQSGNGVIYLINKSYPAGNNLSYTWDFGDSTTSNDPYPTHVYGQNGRYDVKLSVQMGGCSHSHNINLGVDSLGNLYKTNGQGFTIHVLKDGLGLQTEKLQELSVFPNPGDGLYTFSEPVQSLAVFDLNGRNVWKAEVENQKVDLQHLPPGLYFFLMQPENRPLIRKKIIKY